MDEQTQDLKMITPRRSQRAKKPNKRFSSSEWEEVGQKDKHIKRDRKGEVHKRKTTGNLSTAEDPEQATPPATPSGHSTPPATPSGHSTPPVGEKEATACAALLELANPGHDRIEGRGSPSQGSPNSEAKRPSPSDTPQIVSPSETPPFQTGTLLQQVVKEEPLIVKVEPLSDDPKKWTVAQTVSTIIRMDPTIAPEDLVPIREHKIDGSVLITLSFHDLVTYCEMRVGPAAKINNVVKGIKSQLCQQ